MKLPSVQSLVPLVSSAHYQNVVGGARCKQCFSCGILSINPEKLKALKWMFLHFPSFRIDKKLIVIGKHDFAYSLYHFQKRTIIKRY